MELQQESSRFGAATASKNFSSSSSAFVSASQSPFFSPRSPPSNGSPSTVSESNKSDMLSSSNGSQPIPSFIRNNHSRGPDSFCSLNSSSTNDIPSSSYGPSFIRTNQLKNTKKSNSLFSNNSSSTNVHSAFYNAGSDNALAHKNALPHRNVSAHSNTSGHIAEKSSVPNNAACTQTGISFARTSASLSSSARLRSCDVYIGTHGQKPSLLRFTKWLRAELELQGIACFAADRARYTDSRSHEIADRVINSATFGVVIITKKSFANPYTIEELKIFLGRKNLVPLFFDLSPGDCLARDIIEKRGELWEKQGGDLWMLYDGEEKEWKEAVEGLSRVDEWKLEAYTGNWRSCVLRAVSLLGTRLGRRSVAEREKVRKQRLEREEYPFPRNAGFVGRKKELLDLEAILFGKTDGDDDDDEIFDLKIRPKKRDCVIVRKRSDSDRSKKWVDAGEDGQIERRRMSESDRLKDAEEGGLTERRKSEADRWAIKGEEKHSQGGDKAESSKGKELVIWKESEKEIEIQRGRSSQKTKDRRHRSRTMHRARYTRMSKDLNTSYGRGIACVSGESGIGKTELLLEFAYKFSQRYRMVLWVGGEARYLRQNYLNLCLFLGLDVSTGTQIGSEKCRNRTFEEQEMEAFQRVRKELIRDIPYLLVIDNLESERDWWDGRDILELLPRFGGTTHVIISTRLSRVMNLEPLKLSYLSSMEAMALMKGNRRDFSILELDALRVIEERLGRITLGLGLVGTILSELPITPSRLLDTINRVPLRDISWGIREDSTLKNHPFLMQLLDVCFSILDHADEPKKLASRMALVSVWFSPHPIPISLLAVAAHKLPERTNGLQVWKKCLHAVGCCCGVSQARKSETEASAMLIRFGFARSSSRQGWVHIHEIIQLYARKKGGNSAARAMFQGISNRGTISLHSEHLWAACFLIFGFGNDPVIVEPKVSELLSFTKRGVLPLAIHAFTAFSRCHAALELLRLCTNALEAAEESFVSEVPNWLNRSLCWRRPGHTDTQLDEYLWQDVTLLKASLLEIRAKLMLRGGQYDGGEELCRACISIRTVMLGADHPDTVTAQETLAKLVRCRTNIRVG
eukprot:Gb_12687 [translate_table: standard]